MLGLLTFNKMTMILIINASRRSAEDDADDNSEDEDEDESEEKVKLKRSSILKIQCRTYKKQVLCDQPTKYC